jgi:hypothetical protein
MREAGHVAAGQPAAITVVKQRSPAGVTPVTLLLRRAPKTPGCVIKANAEIRLFSQFMVLTDRK